MTFFVGIILSAVVFSLVHSLLANIRDSRPEQTVYEVWLTKHANDNVIPARRDFSVVA